MRLRGSGVQRWMLGGLLFMLCASGGCKESQWKLWQSYHARFVDAQGRVFDPNGDQHTTSEGESYALFFSLAANDRPCFDRVLNWTRANLSAGDLTAHLPAWLWGRSPDGSWKTLDTNSASDADLWIAYTLIEAGRLWKEPSYKAQGIKLAALIAKNEVADLPGFGPMLLPAPVGFQHERAWMLNPSYLPVFQFQRLAVVDPGGPWQKIALNVPRLLNQSTRHGYAMDWVDYVPGDGFYPAALPKSATSKELPVALGSYDAIRVYLWAGMTGNKLVREDLLNALPAMSAYLANHDAPPEKVSDQGVPFEQDGPVGFSAALLPYLRAYPGLSPLVVRQIARMNAQQDASSGLYGKDLSYYDQNLALFATGFLDGRFRFGDGGELTVGWKR
jgi:endoglucanase